MGIGGSRQFFDGNARAPNVARDRTRETGMVIEAPLDDIIAALKPDCAQVTGMMKTLPGEPGGEKGLRA
jgi:hypothetical protein